MSCPMGKPTIYIGEIKGADQLCSKCEADQRLCFRCLYRSVCVGPVRKPHCWFSHEAAHTLKPAKLSLSHVNSKFAFSTSPVLN